MKILVQPDRGMALTYEAPESVKVGDQVELPPVPWQTKYWQPGSIIGVVVGLESDYEGPCRSVLRVLEPEPEPVPLPPDAGWGSKTVGEF